GEVFLKKLALALEQKHIGLEDVSFVPTSHKLTIIAGQLKIPITSLNDSEIDIAIEFVDAVDEDFNFIKRDSFSLVRDKMIAQSAGILVVVAEEKHFSKKIGGAIPFEVSPFGWKRTLSQLSMFGAARLMENDGRPKKSETGNYMIEVLCDQMFSLEDIEIQSKQVPGVLETGLFLGLADKIILHNGRVKVLSRTEYEKKGRI
ncbi:MAG: ribose-5-phosphate isomerase A, partial [Candidatus Diapherotrites archaeon]|nr:ribose-5-phosphate isomerase A [Candidatus Diapherotrites archaeon]